MGRSRGCCRGAGSRPLQVADSTARRRDSWRRETDWSVSLRCHTPIRSTSRYLEQKARVVQEQAESWSPAPRPQHVSCERRTACRATSRRGYNVQRSRSAECMSGGRVRTVKVQDRLARWRGDLASASFSVYSFRGVMLFMRWSHASSRWMAQNELHKLERASEHPNSQSARAERVPGERTKPSSGSKIEGVQRLERAPFATPPQRPHFTPRQKPIEQACSTCSGERSDGLSKALSCTAVSRRRSHSEVERQSPSRRAQWRRYQRATHEHDQGRRTSK